jgi:acylglycerol lipase
VQFLSRVFLAGLTVALAAGTLLRSQPGPRPRTQTPKRVDDTLITGDGVRLPLASWLPESPPRAVMLGLHGYGDYRQAFGSVGPWFAAHDVAFFAYDQRGFGETASRGVWPGGDNLIRDLADAVTMLRGEHGGLPLFVLGESMGGSVALGGLGRGQVTGVDALILAAPGARGDVPMGQLHDLALRLGALALPWLAMELRRGGQPWFDPDEAARLADDPLILRDLRVGTYDGLVELATLASEPPEADLPPTLLLYGGLDRTIPRRAIDDLVLTLGDKDQVTLRVYPEAHHLLLHENHAADVCADCFAWLAELYRRAPR